MRLHNYVWEREYGKIPEGCHIHHIDENVDNNDISNLQCISRSTHLRTHAKSRADFSRENLAKNVRPKASEWHKSSVGRAHHKLNYELFTKDKWEKPITKTCEICGKEYSVKYMAAHKSRFCSNNCKSKYRRMTGIDNEQRICVICGKEYTCNKYSRQIVCSKNCASIKQSQDKTGKPRHKRSGL